MHYKLRKSLLGKQEVHFSCSGCKQIVICPLSEAGTQQSCPSCGGSQQVPGEAEKSQSQAASAAAEESARKLRVEQQVSQERERKRVIEKNELEAAKKLLEAAKHSQQNAESQAVVAADQMAIRTADWADRRMWKAFGFLRRLFAFQLVIGMWVATAGLVIFVRFILTTVIDFILNHGHPIDAAPNGIVGLQLIGIGYALYVTAAMGATLVYIERNTRAILRN